MTSLVEHNYAKQTDSQKRLIFVFYGKMSRVSSSFWLLGVESSDFSHAEKERTACKDEQVHKMTTIFIQNSSVLSF